ncbi:MAG: hypothetical protein HFE45_06245 [Oscillospiraceae bacterium]|jgi:hypothetical protein|nr:hypothetical protein [Oscillospiraceae bacterium]
MILRKPMPQAARTAITALNTVLVIAGAVLILLLSIGTLKAKTDGTFSLFGRSFHLNQSDQMSPMVERSDLVMIRRMSPTSFQMGDLIAFYQEQDGKDYLVIRQLVGMMDSSYYLGDGSGEQIVVSASDTRFLGRVESRSPKLGMAVQFLQSKEGKSIYLWWTGSLLFLLSGVIILLHVIVKNTGVPAEDDDEDYGVSYYDYDGGEDEAEPEEPAQPKPAPRPIVPKPVPPSPAEPEEDWSADAGFAAAFEPAAQPVAEPAPAAPEAAVSESADDDFDLARIISDIQGQLDAEDEKNQ